MSQVAMKEGLMMNQELAASRVDEDGFFNEVCSMPGGECARWCIQCGMCSASCPNVSEMDYSPRKIIALIRAGKRHQVLASNSMWICASCYLCTVRCPKDVKPTELMHTLECLAVRHGLANGKVTTPAAYRAFVDSVKSNGRVHEFGMMVKYYLKTNPFAALKMLPTALKMLMHGRMPLRGEKIKGAEQIKTIIEKAQTLGGVQ